MKSDDIGPHQDRNVCLRSHFLYRRRNNVSVFRVQHDKLVRVKREPDIKIRRYGASRAEGGRDCAIVIQIRQAIATLRMGGERKNLAVDAKSADAELATPAYGVGKGLRVVSRDRRQIGSAHARLKRRDVTMSRRAKANWSTVELAAESPAG